MIKKLVSQLKKLLIILIIQLAERENAVKKWIYIKMKNVRYNKYDKKPLYITRNFDTFIFRYKL